MVGRSEDLRSLSDEVLVAQVARGDEDALAELYDRVGRTAYGLAVRVLRDERLAEDAVQEGFLAVWRSAAAFRAERAKASTWILTLVHRRAVDLVRREELRRTEPLGEETLAARGQVSEPADEAAWLRFERQRVQAALHQLSDVQREALELAYYGGFSQSELAKRLGVPLGTIKSRMFSGLARLRELLDESTQERSWKTEISEEVVEVDRKAWNLAGPQLAPVGPTPDVWPVAEMAGSDTTRPPDAPAAA